MTAKPRTGIVIVDKDLIGSSKICRWGGGREIWEKSSGTLV